MEQQPQAQAQAKTSGPFASVTRVTKVSFTARIDAEDRARLQAIIEHGDARNESEALRFALALTERHYYEHNLVDQFAEASREWRDSGDSDAWRAAESGNP